MNAFESGARKVIPAVLIYPRCGAELLMLHRNAKPDDYHAGKWNGLGGKLEPDESPWQAAAREFHEEAGVALDSARFRLLGVLQFPNFKAHKNEDWVVWVFSLELGPEERTTVVDRGPEGELSWISADQVLSLNLWAGDRNFMPFVLEQRPINGTIWYRGQDVVGSEIRGG